MTDAARLRKEVLAARSGSCGSGLVTRPGTCFASRRRFVVRPCRDHPLAAAYLIAAEALARCTDAILPAFRKRITAAPVMRATV